MLHKRVTIIEDRTVEQFKRNRNFKHILFLLNYNFTK